MVEFWLIVLPLPIIIITSLFLGFEPSFYCGMSLFGLSFWKLGEKPKLKKIGVVLCIVGTILFYATFVYFFSTGSFFPENPFEFKIPALILMSMT